MKYPTVHRTAPPQGIFQPQKSTVPRLRSCYRCKSSYLPSRDKLYSLGVEEIFCFSLTIFSVFTGYLDGIYQLSENLAVCCLQKNSSKRAIQIGKMQTKGKCIQMRIRGMQTKAEVY